MEGQCCTIKILFRLEDIEILLLYIDLFFFLRCFPFFTLLRIKKDVRNICCEISIMEILYFYTVMYI